MKLKEFNRDNYYAPEAVSSIPKRAGIYSRNKLRNYSFRADRNRSASIAAAQPAPAAVIAWR